MASKKPQYQIPAPNTGVRKDVDPLVIDQTMAADGANMLYFDGVLRPRPALDVSITEQLSIENFQLILDGVDEFGADADLTCYGMASANDQSWILLPTEAADWICSRDGGLTWTQETLSWPLVDGYIMDMCVAGDYLYALVEWHDGTEWVFDMYSTPTADILDEGMSWTLQSADPIPLLGREYLNFEYNADYDAIFFTSSYHVTVDLIVEYYAPMIWVFNDASTGSPTEQILGESDYELGVYGYKPTSHATFVDGKHLMYAVTENPTYSPTPVSDSRYASYIFSDSLTYNSGTGLFELVRGEKSAEIWFYSSTTNTIRNPLEVPLIDTTPGNAGYAYSIVDARKNNEVLFSIASENSAEPGSQFIAAIEFDDDGFTDNPPTKRFILDATGEGRSSYFGKRTDERIVFFFDGAQAGILVPEVCVSTDNGTTFMHIKSEYDLPSIGTIWPQVYFNDVSDQHYFLINYDSDIDNNYQPLLWLMPSSSGDSKFGAFNMIYQADLDDEEDALIAGTTKALLRLDKDTNTWERITADQTEAIDGSTGDTPGTLPYTPDGVYDWDLDIPPLSVDASDDGYVSGLTIDTVYGQNPWVFRTTEASGKTFLVATNGQCYPLIYHPDMNGGFARQLGVVPTTNDPNYRVMSTEETFLNWLANGNIAPRAKCMASAANRLILANNPDGSPFEVNVGGFNDPDRGWNAINSQLVLLGDTPGEIVTMEEISALQVAIYKEDAIYHAIAQTEFLGVSAPFRFELAKAGVAGPCSPASVLRNFDGRQIYLARDGGVYMYDGVAPLDGGRNIRRMIQNDIDLNNLGKCWGMVDRQRKLVWFFYPGRNQQINKGIVVSTDQGYPWPTWPVKLPVGWNFTCGAEINLSKDGSLSDLAEFGSYSTETLSSFSSGQVAMLTGRDTGVFFQQKWEEDENGFSDSGLPIKCSMKGGWLSPGGLQIHTADELYHIFSSPDPEQEILVRLRAQKIGQNIQTSAWRTLTASKPRRMTRHRVTGAQFGVDIKADAKHNFSWAGAIMTASNGGRNRG